MTVWVLMGCIDYEGNYLLGVYSTKENAEKAEEKHALSKAGAYSDYLIESAELDKLCS